jgi:translation initiation factor 1 (eIF-1/SUI1)
MTAIIDGIRRETWELKRIFVYAKPRFAVAGNVEREAVRLA